MLPSCVSVYMVCMRTSVWIVRICGHGCLIHVKFVWQDIHITPTVEDNFTCLMCCVLFTESWLVLTFSNVTLQCVVSPCFL